MNKTKNILLATIAICLITVLSLLFVQIMEFRKNDEIKLINNDSATQAFVELHKNIDEFNTGIELVALLLEREQPDTLPFVMWAENHSKEVIVFPNNGFGVKVYRYDAETGVWSEVKIKIVPGTFPIAIQPNAIAGEDYNHWILNTNSLSVQDFSKPIRIFISGRGEISGKNYGAYKDVFIEYKDKK